MPQTLIEASTTQPMYSLACLKGGHVFGVEVVLDVADDAARLADAPLAQEHDLEVVVPLAVATPCEHSCQMAIARF